MLSKKQHTILHRRRMMCHTISWLSTHHLATGHRILCQSLWTDGRIPHYCSTRQTEFYRLAYQMESWLYPVYTSFRIFYRDTILYLPCCLLEAACMKLPPSSWKSVKPLLRWMSGFHTNPCGTSVLVIPPYVAAVHCRKSSVQAIFRNPTVVSFWISWSNPTRAEIVRSRVTLVGCVWSEAGRTFLLYPDVVNRYVCKSFILVPVWLWTWSTKISLMTNRTKRNPTIAIVEQRLDMIDLQ